MKKVIPILLATMFVLTIPRANAAQVEKPVQETASIPVATQWLLDSAGEVGRSALKSVYLIYCPTSKKKGTGFLLNNNVIVTAAHVVKGSEVKDIIGISTFGHISFRRVVLDENRDLALLIPRGAIRGGLSLNSGDDPLVGSAVTTWGFPFGHNGPDPLLSVGYVAGYLAVPADDSKKKFVKHLLINGAFNPGNSGGPLFKANDDRVIGVVVAKDDPMNAAHKAILEALAKQKYGIQYTGTDASGNKITMSEAQLVASMLEHFRNTSQVMIGRAISASELRTFLEENGLGLK